MRVSARDDKRVSARDGKRCRQRGTQGSEAYELARLVPREHDVQLADCVFTAGVWCIARKICGVKHVCYSCVV